MNLDDPMDATFGSANFDPTYFPIMNLESKLKGKGGSKRPTTLKISTKGVIIDPSNTPILNLDDQETNGIAIIDPTNTPILNLDDQESVSDDEFFDRMQSRSARFDPSNTPILNLASDAFKLATSDIT
jgi:hypothetical protein